MVKNERIKIPKVGKIKNKKIKLVQNIKKRTKSRKMGIKQARRIPMCGSEPNISYVKYFDQICEVKYVYKKGSATMVHK